MGPRAILAFASLSLLLLGPACSPSYPRLSFAVEQRLLRETTLEDMSEGKAGPGDAVVRLVHLGRDAQGSCSGAIIGPKQVLTAQHCVLDESGRRERWSPTAAIASPADLHVEMGGGYLPWGRSGVREIYPCDDYDHDAEHDLAVLVIATAVPRDAPILQLSYGDPTEAGVFELDGFGSAKKARSVPGTGWMVFEGERHVVRGPVLSATRTLIKVGLKGVHGDSGGPILDMTTGKIVSVASMASADPKDPDLVIVPRLATCRSAIELAFGPVRGGTILR